MTSLTNEPIGQVVTEADIGRVFVDRYTYHRLTARGLGPEQQGVDWYLIAGLRPADPSYYTTCPDAGPRVEVELRKIRRDGTVSPATTRRWLPTTGNTARVEVVNR